MNPELPAASEKGKLLFHSQGDSRSIGGLIFACLLLWFGWSWMGFVLKSTNRNPSGEVAPRLIIMLPGFGALLGGCFVIAEFISPRRVDFFIHRRGILYRDTKLRGKVIWWPAKEIESCRVVERSLRIQLRSEKPLLIPLNLIDFSAFNEALRKMMPPVKIPSNAPEGYEEEEEPTSEPCLSCGAPIATKATRCRKCGWSFADAGGDPAPEEDAPDDRH
jgi:hypothetical protein